MNIVRQKTRFCFLMLDFLSALHDAVGGSDEQAGLYFTWSETWRQGYETFFMLNSGGMKFILLINCWHFNIY